MAGEWRELPFSEAVEVNPPVALQRGVVYPFVDISDSERRAHFESTGAG
jgi:hypothetical protein